LGRLLKKEGLKENLYLRDLTNKIIHAADLEWNFSDSDKPKLKCIAKDTERWTSAEIDVVSLAALCGRLMS
ncbi:MAG TPA: hypothetical protein VLV87_10220, partial [Gammaproteobacteria bacterium]|nr:hypothetical protein [Gammaproteobacteria bacterium]